MKRLCLMVFLACLAALPGGAQTADRMLTMAVSTMPPARGNPYIGLGLPSSLALQAVFDRLMIIGGNGMWEPWLAESAEFQSPNTWTIRLKDNVRFSNGEPLDAEAVAAAMNYLLSPEGATTSVGSQMARIKMRPPEVIDRLNIKFSTDLPSPVLPLSLAFLRVPAPKYFAEVGMDGFALQPIGTGPFTIDTWEPGRLTLNANSDSWRAPKLDRVDLIPMKDHASRLQALLSESVDVAFTLSPEDTDAIEAAGGRVVINMKPEVAYLAMVTVKDSPVKDPQVRIAMNHAINREAIIEAFLGGATEPASQMVHDLAFGFNDDLEPYAYDPDKARRMLADAGYPDGFTFPILVVPGVNNVEPIYQQIASDLARVGITMEISRTVLPQYLEFLYRKPWPSLGFAMQGSGFDALSFYRTRSCSWQNPYHCDEGMMPLIERALNAETFEERRDATKAAVRREAQNPPGIMLWQNPEFNGLGPRVGTFRIERDIIRFHELDVAN